MSHTNSTANLSLPQFIGTDKPTWLSDVNGAFAAIDSYAGSNDAALAITDGKADTAIADASNAVTTAGNAATTAGNAAATATAANTVAGNALTVANGINSKVGVLTDLTTTDKSTVVNAINEVNGKDAGDIAYDNTGSGLTATNVQAAIDEVAQGGGGSSTPIAKFTVTSDGIITYGQAVTQIGTYIASNPITEKAYLVNEHSGGEDIFHLSDFQTNAFSGLSVGTSNVTFNTLITSTGNWRQAYGSGSGVTVNTTVDTSPMTSGDKLVLYDYQ